MKLKELLGQLDSYEIKNDREIDVKDIVFDSRKVEEGAMFVCVKGHLKDGHLYGPMAYEKGASCLLVEDYLDLPITQVKVKDSRSAMGELATYFFNDPSKKLKLVGITGSNGKSMTTMMLNSIFKEGGMDTGIIGTIVNKSKELEIKSSNTTPESRDLQYYLNEMVKEDIHYCFLEVSASGIEQGRVRTASFDTVIFNNISKEHIDEFKTFENYINIKASFIKKNKDSFKVLNDDDLVVSKLKDELEGEVFTYGIDNKKASIVAENIDVSTGFANFDLRINDEGLKKYMAKEDKDLNRVKISLSVPGYHNVYNALCAMLTALIHGIKMDDVIKGMGNYKGTERRFEMIYNDKFKVLDDHFANPGNIDATMKTLSLMDYNKIHIYYAVRGSRGVTGITDGTNKFVEWLKEIGLDSIDYTISLGDVEEKDRVLEEEEREFLRIIEANNIKYRKFDTICEGLEVILDEVKEGDLLLLAGCQGMDKGGRYLLHMINERKISSEGYDVLAPLVRRTV